EPNRERPYRVPFYPWLPAFFVAAAAVVIAYILGNNWRNSLGGVAVIVLGLPMYLWMARRRKQCV
ncbi:MAG TPA: amino acid transporter, partial [Acidobacteriaceae bacterium]|nr:amino acid transporter [Acidobacteriaceae bacterium]